MKMNVPGPPVVRRDRLIQERVHDPYKTRSKLREPTVCPVCKAVYRGGRWQWVELLPIKANEETCQACHRIKDDFPAGVLTLTGSFVNAHRNEIISVARRHEKLENAEHPLHRILRIEEQPDALVIKTTDIHLPRRIADGIHHAFKGHMAVHYDEGGYLFRANWNRDIE